MSTADEEVVASKKRVNINCHFVLFTDKPLNCRRGDKAPSKELLRLFIRTYAIRAGQTPASPWIVDDAQVRKLDLQSKFASFLLSPVKVGII